MIEFAHPVLATTSLIDIGAFADWVRLQHGDQKRRDGTPYFMHCVKVAAFARDIGCECGMDQVALSVIEAAGYGHDLFEDTQTDFEDVAKRSSDEVARAISWVSDDKRLPAAIRHHLYANRLQDAPIIAQIVKLADLHDNSNDSFALFDKEPQPLRFLRRWQVRAQATLAVLHLTKHVSLHKKVEVTLAGLESRLDALAVPQPAG